MPLTEAQQKIAQAPQRFRVAICGRRFGKTHLAIREMCKVAAEPNRDIYYVSPSYRMSKTIAFKRLKEKLLDLRWVKKINETEMTFLLKNNSTISLKGAENYDSLRGVGLDFLVMDEFAMIDLAAWEEVLRPALSDKQGKALFISTPAGMNWAKDLYDLAEQYPEEWAAFSFTSAEGGQIPLAEIEAAKRTLAEKQFRQEYMATWETYSGRVFYAFERKQNLKTFDIKDYHSVRMADTLHIGMDFNIDPMTAVIAVREAQYLHVIDEVRMMGSNTDEMVMEIKTRYPNKSITVYPDPAGAARKTAASGRTDHTILRMAGFAVKAPHAHKPVRDGINAVNAKLRSSTGEITMFIDPKCKYTTESLEKLVYKEGSSQPDKASGFDHTADALRYMVDWLFPITQPAQPLPIRTWGHKVSRFS